MYFLNYRSIPVLFMYYIIIISSLLMGGWGCGCGCGCGWWVCVGGCVCVWCGVCGCVVWGCGCGCGGGGVGWGVWVCGCVGGVGWVWGGVYVRWHNHFNCFLIPAESTLNTYCLINNASLYKGLLLFVYTHNDVAFCHLSFLSVNKLSVTKMTWNSAYIGYIFFFPVVPKSYRTVTPEPRYVPNRDICVPFHP